MASSSKHETPNPDLSASLAADRLVGELPAQIRKNMLTTPIEIVSFWLAVTLPFLYLPLLVSGVSTNGELLTVLTLLGLNVVALVVGHDHRRAVPGE